MRFLFVILLFIGYLFAQEKQIEIYATDVTTKDEIVNISGDLVVVYGEYILSAKRALYNKQTGILELFDDVKISNNGLSKILGKYARLDVREKKRIFKPFYMLDKKSDVWISAEEGCANNKDIDISSGVLSGCDPLNPLWQIEFSSSDYNADSKWLNVYNMTLYIYDIPVLYTPYFGYSLDTTRRTGLLTPSFGFSNDEGVYFEQPLYIAEQNWWDLEFKPQIRTKRGNGIYSTFRFVDSKVSKGSFTYGTFKEKEDYFLDNNLANKNHYGFNFKYQNDNFLKSWFNYDTLSQSVIYLDSAYMNDVDYINLATNDTTKNITSSQVLSRLNIFFNSDKNYIATYSKYYMDLRKENNKDVIQQLPSLHYHRYLDTLLENHLLYNFNIKTTNYYRKEKTNAIRTDIDIPIGLRTTLFDEYLNISYQTDLFFQQISFKNNEETAPDLRNGLIARNYNQINISTQLIKVYDSFIHTLNFYSSYIKDGYENKNGYYEDYFEKDCQTTDDGCDFYDISKVQEALTLNFSQYIYNKSGDEILYHKLSNIIYDPTGEDKNVGEVENELNLHVTKSITLYNDTFYSFLYDDFSKTLNKISYKDYGFDISISHYYKKDFLNLTHTSYITSSFKYKYNSHYSYFMSYKYDTVLKSKKQANIGFLYQKRCWDFGLKYSENNRPVLNANDEAASVYDRYLYFTVVLKPIMKKSTSNFFGLKLPKVLN